MGNVQDQSAVQDAMVVDEVQDTAPEVSADDLYNALTSEEEATEETEPETEQEEPELTPEEAQKKAIEGDIRTLMDDGMDGETLNGLARVKSIREAVQSGKSFRQAVMAYLIGQHAQGKAEKPAKRGVPTATRAATAGTHEPSAIEDMSDEEFARFSEKAVRLAREGKRVTIR